MSFRTSVKGLLKHTMQKARPGIQWASPFFWQLPSELRMRLLDPFAQNFRAGKVDPSLPPGINLIGFARAEMGLGQGCRLIADALEAAGIPYCVLDFAKGDHARNESHSLYGKIASEAKYAINLVHVNPDALPMARLSLPKGTFSGRYSIGFWLWELEEIPEDWKRELPFFHELWAPSRFIADALERATDKMVPIIPYGFASPAPLHFTREHYSLPDNALLFLCLFDINSIMERKNPLGTLRAFQKAFDREDRSVGLVIKVNARQTGAPEIAQLRELIAGYKNIYLLPQIYNRQEVNDLIGNCDALVSLHRSEGFGLVMAEAMAYRRPVVATGWSANVDFMPEGSAALVGYRLIPIEKDCGPYKMGQRWADPDIEDAAAQMRRLKDDPAWYAKLAEAGCRVIREEFSRARSAEALRENYQRILSTLSEKG